MNFKAFKSAISRQFPLVKWEFSHPEGPMAESGGIKILYSNVGWNVFTITLEVEGFPHIHFHASSVAEARSDLEALADLLTKLTDRPSAGLRRLKIRS